MRNNFPCNYFDTFFLKYWTFSPYARVNVLQLWAQHKPELVQKGLLTHVGSVWPVTILRWWEGRTTSSLRHHPEHHVAPRTKYRLCSCSCGCVQLAELAAALRGCQSAHCAWVCRLKVGNVACWLLWVRGISLRSVTSINKNIVKLLTWVSTSTRYCLNWKFSKA